MNALGAFYSVWSRAREIFGQGIPQDGAAFDGSAKLRQMQQSVEAAAPDSRWQGPASEAYAAKNKEHAAVYGKLADLDMRMAAEITSAADVVTVGRRDLDEIKSWVDTIADTIPAASSANDRDSKLLMIANEGIGKVGAVVNDSQDAMAVIAKRIHAIKSEYEAVGPAGGGPGSVRKGPNVRLAAWDPGGMPATIPDLGGKPADPANPALPEWECMVGSGPTADAVVKPGR